MADDQCDETTALKSQAASDGDGVRVEAIEMQNRVDAAPPAVEPSPPLHPDAADPGSTSTSRFPILFERSATNSWWNPRFDSDVLEAQHRTTSFPQTRRRFRYALDYVIMSCSAWLTQFVIQRGPSWPAFVGVAATLLVVAIVLYIFTRLYASGYRRFVLPISVGITIALCACDLMTFAAHPEEPHEGDVSAVGTFVWSIEIILLMYTLIPMPLYVCVLIGTLYSVVFEVVAASAGDMAIAKYIAGRALLHVCIHAVGIHIYVMSQVRERSTFLKVGQSLILRRRLQTEKLLKHNMIHSLMPPKVAEQVLRSREGERSSDDRSGAVGGGGDQPGAGLSTDMFRRFHMLQMDNVSILFADIVGFTKMSSNKSAKHLVMLLNDLFGRFDDLCLRHGCEKISTLGDCYYCVSGCPEPREDHARCCVEMGLAMCVAIQEFDRVHSEEVNMRVGVHTGTVLCGIVGTRRFKFDVWSHDVTLANMMESEGKPGRVHVSDDTHRFIKDLYEVEPGDEVEDIRKHKELIEEYDRATGQYVVTIVEKRAVATPRVKTWFIIRRLFEPEEPSDVVPASGDGDAAPHVTVKVENSVIDGAVTKEAGNKDLSAAQLLGKREHMITSTEELNGELSGANGSMVQRTATARDDFDRQLLECINEQSVAHDYLYNPKINQCTLSFTKSYLEAEYRKNYTSSEPSDVTHPTLALPRYSGLCDVIVSCVFFVLVVLCCFVSFNVHTTWIIVCVTGVVVEVTILLPVILSVCLSRRISIIHRLSSWYPRHLCGVIVTSMPSVAAYSAFSCAMFDEVSGSDRFYCLLVITTLLHYCNFTMLSSWMKSPLATITGVVLLILIGVGTCPLPVNFGNTTTYVPLEDIQFPEIFPGGEPILWKLPILDILLLLLLVWFLNREIEISYRLCYHGDVEAVSDRQKIQAEKEQADSLLRNILPEHVADVLKRHEGYSQTYENVGVIFAKISNFDDFYDEAYEGGREFLRVLNELMGDFEELFDTPKYKDVEKIKTIGSCLMASAGLNKEKRDQNKDPKAHLYSLMDFSMDLLKKLDQFNRDMLSFQFEMEIGYNFGEVTAGVVGTTKLLYDIWGDAVNVASRMYSTGVHGKIQVTEFTANELGEKFEFEHRGTVFVKGKGDMNTYLLVRKKDGATWE